MTPLQLIIAWIAEHEAESRTLAAHAVVSLLLDAEGEWLGESDFPSGADYIDHITHVMESVGLYRHIDNLQKNEKTD